MVRQTKFLGGRQSEADRFLLPAIELIEKNRRAFGYRREIKVHMPQIRGKLAVLPGTFNPALTNVSPFFAENLSVRWAGEHFLEVGAGTGFISILLAQRGAKVTATDMTGVAEKCVRKNVRRFKLGKKIRFVRSNLFEGVVGQKFDTIVFNPPLVPKAPTIPYGDRTTRHLVTAIFDPHSKVITGFFREARKHLAESGRILIIYTNLAKKMRLTEIHPITELCKKHGFRKKTIAKKTAHGETYSVYELKPRKV